MIQEKLSNIKPPIQEEHAPVVEEPIKEVAEEQVVDQHVLENIQAKTDLICKDILEDLFFEMGEGKCIIFAFSLICIKSLLQKERSISGIK